MRKLALVVCGLCSACMGLQLKVVERSTKLPGNVWVYFTVDRWNGDPVPGLTADRFTIYEEGKPISALEAQHLILNREVAAAHHTLLLVDMSGSVTQSGQVPKLQAAAQAFTARIEPLQKVGLYAFDGSPKLTAIVPLAGGTGSVGPSGPSAPVVGPSGPSSPVVGPSGPSSPVVGPSSPSSPVQALGSLAAFQSKDPSTNLNGGVVEAIRTLDASLARSPKPLKFGTLVIFTDGTDRANRVPRDEMMKVVDESPYDIFVIGIGAEIDQGELKAIGRSGTVLDKGAADVQLAFESIAGRVEGYTKRYYLLSYCSPARAGERMLRIEAVTADGKRGSLEDRFNADGFQPSCDPKKLPSFDTALRNRRPGVAVGQPERRAR